MNYEQLIIQGVRKYGPISKRELQQTLGLSWGLTTRIVNDLYAQGYFESCFRKSDGKGRRAEEYDINRDENYFIGIDLNYRAIVIVVTDMKARIVMRKAVEITTPEREYECVIGKLFQALDEIFEKNKKRKICGIGMAVQGIVRREEGVSVHIGHFRNWQNIPLKTMLEERYGVEVHVEHDPVALMKSEKNIGCMQRTDITEAILISINHRTGIGMSIMIRNEIYYGANERAGEVGYAFVSERAEGAGRYLEEHVLAEDIVADYKALTGESKEISFREIEKRAKAGDPACRKIFERLGENIGIAISYACSILNPQIVVIYATSCECADLLFEQMQGTILNNTFDKNTEIVLSTLNNEAVVHGATLIAIENEIEKI